MDSWQGLSFPTLILCLLILSAINLILVLKLRLQSKPSSDESSAARPWTSVLSRQTVRERRKPVVNDDEAMWRREQKEKQNAGN